ncbi:MAG: DedA family protein [Alphaproteobacteria bacterium]|nr:MAG: DedA family protein [Alphaproteobacteria bacterium]
MLDFLVDWVRNNGDLVYLLIFGWTFIEGETIVLFAGVAAERDLISLELLILSAWLGSYAGDQVVFFLGRRYGRRLLQRFPRLQPKINNANAWLVKYDIWFILSYRFIYGVRNVSSVAMGLSHISWKRFAWVNCLAAFIWACSFSAIGYLFGKGMGGLLGDVVEEAMIGMLLLVAMMVALHWVVKRIVAKFAPSSVVVSDNDTSS